MESEINRRAKKFFGINPTHIAALTWLLVSTCLTFALCDLAPIDAAPPNLHPYRAAAIRRIKVYETWVNAPWTDNDTPYVAIRHQLPHTYNFARLAFLCLNVGFTDVRLIGLGNRLIRADPSDVSVLNLQVGVLTMQPKAAWEQLAEKYARDIAVMRPGEPATYASLGWAYYSAWSSAKKRSDADEAISDYEKYLQLGDPQSAYRPRALKILEEIKNGIRK